MRFVERLLNEHAWRKCRGHGPQDFDAFCCWAETYAHIQHPERGAILIELRPAQREILQTWMAERFSIVLKARQVGYSTIAALYCLWLALFHADRQIVMLSRGEREAVDLLGKADYAFTRLPEWMRARGPRRLDRNQKAITFDNGSKIRSLPSKEDPARGTAVSLVVVDEWAFFENAEEAWASIEPITDVGGRCIALSTANGWGSFYHTMWVAACKGTSRFKPMFFPWSANSDRDENWYAAKKAEFESTPWMLHQEYPDNAEEAFIKSGATVFDVDMLRSMPIERPKAEGVLSVVESGERAPEFHKKERGFLRIWQYPEVGDGYAIGADVAEGLSHGDYSSAHVISLKRGAVVAVWHGHIDPDDFGFELARLGWYYNAAFIGCEANNHGLTTNKALQRADYPRVYVRRELDGRGRSRKQGSKLGWLTTRVSKPLMIDELSREMHAGLVVPDQATVVELMTYVRDDRGSMNGSPHDDRVVSLAIANQMRTYISTEEFREPGDGYWTFGWLLEKMMAKPKDAAPRLGQHHQRAA